IVSRLISLYVSSFCSQGYFTSCQSGKLGIKLYRLVAVSFGLLCILQATLNISLRLWRYAEVTVVSQVLVDTIKTRWVYFSDRVYYISSTKKTWQDSRNDCLQKGADLMIINSKEEQLKDNVWIGLTDRETEGTWKWVDGTPLTTSYWAKNEPSKGFLGQREDCGEVMLHQMKENWNDKLCDEPNFWICEMNMIF
uniref:C-type lectin domain-containing protein n=1 Tax=Seriola dumerili TaxID=41447 RepID=A0A3B4U2G1_SERDU